MGLKLYSLCLILLYIAVSILAAYPYQPFPNQPYPNQPYPNQPYPNPPYPNRDTYQQVQQPPQYLVYTHGVYKLTNITNNTNSVQGHDFIFGAKSPQDKLLLHTVVYKRPGFWSGFATKEITFPPPGSTIRVNITQVNAYDKGKNGTGGFVKMIRGGIGRENVTLLFKSQKNRPINFLVDIYGLPRR